MSNLTYQERLQRYEAEKRELYGQNLSDFEYFKKIKELADKWDIQLNAVVKAVCIMTLTETNSLVVTALTARTLKKAGSIMSE